MGLALLALVARHSFPLLLLLPLLLLAAAEVLTVPAVLAVLVKQLQMKAPRLLLPSACGLAWCPTVSLAPAPSGMCLGTWRWQRGLMQPLLLHLQHLPLLLFVLQQPATAAACVAMLVLQQHCLLLAAATPPMTARR